MKRVPVLLLVVVLLTGILTGCGNPVESFNKASEKTERVNSAKVKFSSNVNMEFYEDSFTAEEKKELGKYKKVTVQGEYYFDKSKKENLNKINFNLAGKGVDLKIYGRKGETYIVTPLLPKILVIKEDDLKSFKMPGNVKMPFGFLDASGTKNPDVFISKEAVGKLSKYWINLLKKGNIARLGNIILSTPDGDVKARKFNISLKEEHLKPALKESLDILREDMISKNPKNAKDLEKVFAQLEKMMDSAKIEKFLYEAYIDRDDYIVEDTVNLKISFPEDKSSGLVKSFELETTSTMWDMEKPVTIDFPAINKQNSMTLDELQKRGEFPEGVF
ncbi:hypothetical protein DXT63_06525 [Thermoanaerobacteraceae bacterium SP2]|nr:hypothetical protein DXT63_06525 [Thermoanaerobacteraceae bacterium SP2]